jgi:hypothetical protein
VTVRLITYTDNYYGMSQRDIELARQISAAARKLGLSADPSAVQSILVIPGASAPAAVLPFWRAVRGYEHRRDNPSENLVHAVGGRRSGSTEWMSRARTAAARSTSRSGSRKSSRTVASLRRSPLGAGSYAMSSRRHGGLWPMRRATRPTSPRRRAATEWIRSKVHDGEADLHRTYLAR